MNLSDYIQLPREQRIAHIDLTTPCDCWTGNQSWGKEKMRTKLLSYHNLTVDMKGYGTPCCHLCKHNSKSNTVCINPLHMYIGTPTENLVDLPNELTPTRTLHEVMGVLSGTITPEQLAERNRKVAQNRWANTRSKQRESV
jgi:hypothetical protein